MTGAELKARIDFELANKYAELRDLIEHQDALHKNIFALGFRAGALSVKQIEHDSHVDIGRTVQ